MDDRRGLRRPPQPARRSATRHARRGSRWRPAGSQRSPPLPPDLPVTPGRKLRFEVSAEHDDGKKVIVREELPITGPLFLTHLMTDRPMYRPGEKVYFRSLTLERFSFAAKSGSLSACTEKNAAGASAGNSCTGTSGRPSMPA